MLYFCVNNFLESYKMDGENIRLFELATSHCEVVISPMLREFQIKDEVTTIFAPHRHDYYSLFF